MAHSKYALAQSADMLSLEQVENLVNWKGWHNNEYFTREVNGQWQELNLRGLLTLYNASADYDSLEGWLEEKRGAVKAFKSIHADSANWIVTE